MLKISLAIAYDSDWSHFMVFRCDYHDNPPGDRVYYQKFTGYPLAEDALGNSAYAAMLKWDEICENFRLAKDKVAIVL